LKPGILFYDIETDGLNVEKTRMAWFGCFSTTTNEYYVYDCSEIKRIRHLLDTHDIIVGFNILRFDNAILHNTKIFEMFEPPNREGVYYFPKKKTIDLYNACDSKQQKKLLYMGYELKSYSLDNICRELKLGENFKLDMDYELFKRESWTNRQRKLIREYVIRDIELCIKLFNFLDDLYSEAALLLLPRYRDRYIHISASIASLSYHILCSMSNREVVWRSEHDVVDVETGKPKEEISVLRGGHHVTARWEKIKGRLISVDFRSAYPHQFIMGNLYSHSCSCCTDKEKLSKIGKLKLFGKYCVKKRGSMEEAVFRIFTMRREAKLKWEELEKNGGAVEDIKKYKGRDVCYKIIINSLYGASANKNFSVLYNINSANDCTLMTRFLLRMMAAKLEANDVKMLYGCTDSCYLSIPSYLETDRVLDIISHFLNNIKREYSFPEDTFTMPMEKQYKFLWFVGKKKNKYLWVDNDGALGYKSTLIGKKAAKVSVKIWEEYISPKIKKELDVNFTKEEIRKKVISYLNKDPTLLVKKFSTNKEGKYKTKTSLQYRIYAKYGGGEHELIPNTAGLGVGVTKKYCKVEEYIKKGLGPEFLDHSTAMDDLKYFYKDTGVVHTFT
jgi:DNA polymerase elongation subunit (family B)